MIKDESFQQQHRKWMILYKLAFLLASGNFIVCNLLTLPLVDTENAIPLYNLLLRISCIFFMLAETGQYVIMPFPNKRIHCFLMIISIIGYAFFIRCSYQYSDFNSGAMYMVAAFLVCGSTQLKVLWIITRKGQNIRRSIKQNKYGFMKHILVSSSIFMFLIGTVISTLNLDDENLTTLLISIFNSLSGLLMLGAVYNLIKNGKQIKVGEESHSYSGYTSFEHQAPQILTVGD